MGVFVSNPSREDVRTAVDDNLKPDVQLRQEKQCSSCSGVLPLSLCQFCQVACCDGCLVLNPCKLLRSTHCGSSLKACRPCLSAQDVRCANWNTSEWLCEKCVNEKHYRTVRKCEICNIDRFTPVDVKRKANNQCAPHYDLWYYRCQNVTGCTGNVAIRICCAHSSHEINDYLDLTSEFRTCIECERNGPVNGPNNNCDLFCPEHRSACFGCRQNLCLPHASKCNPSEGACFPSRHFCPSCRVWLIATLQQCTTFRSRDVCALITSYI